MARAAEAAQERLFPQQSLYANHCGIKVRDTAIKAISKTNGNSVVHCMVLLEVLLACCCHPSVPSRVLISQLVV